MNSLKERCVEGWMAGEVEESLDGYMDGSVDGEQFDGGLDRVR